MKSLKFGSVFSVKEVLKSTLVSSEREIFSVDPGLPFFDPKKFDSHYWGKKETSFNSLFKTMKILYEIVPGFRGTCNSNLSTRNSFHSEE